MYFSILDDADTPGYGGAQLSFSGALTDGDGAVTLQVIARQGTTGPEPLKFKVEASAGDLDPVPIQIFVTTSALASVKILPVFVDRSSIDNSATAINIYFYDDTSCASVSRTIPLSMRRVETMSLNDPPKTFTNVVTSGVHAVLGLAIDNNQNVVAQGCSDLPGASLSPSSPCSSNFRSPGSTLHLWAASTPCPSFPSPPLPGTVSAQDAWKDLSSDACDPARLWLDCTIDALSGTSAEDPLDCQPVPGGEGPLGALLADRRDATVGSSTCAAELDGSGRPSLDAEVYALFPADSLAALQLKELPDELGNALTSLTIESTLTVTANGPPNAFNIDHALTAIELPNAAVPSSIAMTTWRPVWEAAFVSGVSQAGELTSAFNSFTLELGSAARFTFAASSLAPRLRADRCGRECLRCDPDELGDAQRERHDTARLLCPGFAPV